MTHVGDACSGDGAGVSPPGVAGRRPLPPNLPRGRYGGSPGAGHPEVALGPRLPAVDEDYERTRARLLAALAEHERGELDHAGLQAAVQDVLGALDHAHAESRQTLFEADVALEYAQFGRPVDGSDPGDPESLKRIRRNLREALG